MEASQQHHTISPTSQQDEQSTRVRVYGTAIPRMVEPQSAESRNECHLQVQSFSQHRRSHHCLCPRRKRYLFLYSFIANFRSPCPNLLISVDKRPGGLQPISWWWTTIKVFFPSQTNPAPVPKHPEDKTILSFHITMLQRNKHSKSLSSWYTRRIYYDNRIEYFRKRDWSASGRYEWVMSIITIISTIVLKKYRPKCK